MMVATIVAGVAVSDSEWLPVFGREPPTKRWIWYTEVGVRDSGPPVIYIAERRFNTMVPEILVVLSPKRYELLAAFTMHQIEPSLCPASRSGPLPRYSLKISQRSSGHIVSCILPGMIGCDYLEEVMNLPGVKWTRGELQALESLSAHHGCGH